MPDRFLKESINVIPAKDQFEELRQMLEELYNERRLDRYGRPRKEKLLELSL